MEPGMAAEQHVSDTLERSGRFPLAVASLPKRRVRNAVAEELQARRLRQSEHVEAGEIRAAECAQESIEALEQELQLLKGSAQ
jgi:rRNA maturation endonuclease Nob1